MLARRQPLFSRRRSQTNRNDTYEIINISDHYCVERNRSGPNACGRNIRHNRKYDGHDRHDRSNRNSKHDDQRQSSHWSKSAGHVDKPGNQPHHGGPVDHSRQTRPKREDQSNEKGPGGATGASAAYGTSQPHPERVSFADRSVKADRTTRTKQASAAGSYFLPQFFAPGLAPASY